MEIIIPVVLFIVVIAIVRSVLKIRERKQQIQNRNLLETVTKSDRGTYSERNLVLKFLKSGIPAVTIFHDLYVRKPNGNFSQIDLVVVTTAGIIVFEVKDYSGWIFGKGFQEQWTRVLAFGKQKYRFYNPIMQNNKHIVDLKSTRRQFENIPFYSVIVFDGDCELRDISFVPEGTFVVRVERILEVLKVIQSKETAPYTDKYEVIAVLKEAVENGANKDTELRHKEKVTDLLGKHRVFD
jgi:Holliday junction resolvase